MTSTLRDAHPLWDIPTRIFHWLVVCLLPLSWWSAQEGHYDLHQWSGYAVLVLVALWWAALIAVVLGLTLWWGLRQAPRPTLLYG